MAGPTGICTGRAINLTSHSSEGVKEKRCHIGFGYGSSEIRMIDRTTKILLALIAAGLWMNAVSPLLKVNVAHADSDLSLAGISSSLADTAVMLGHIDMAITDISQG